ncbi:MerR family transcriptional regulator [Aureimonas populi]|uniref:MerR family transcriptional regulator n=1 Tax=Aureimonas populi TaxID=1701758 RepID=A0ABW5CFI8_9HYPH|nr:MerR family transcriptional regulator [Aureimonas populi]
MSEKSADAFRTISEVAEELDLPQHVLRFWETRFPQIKPMKRGGGRRYYRPDDVELLKGIRVLLYVRGFTIKGVQRILKENGNRFVIAVGAGDLSGLDQPSAPPAPVFEPDEAEAEDAPSERSRSGLSALLRRDRDRNGSALPPGPTAELNRVLLELLELKRILDQVR